MGMRHQGLTLVGAGLRGRQPRRRSCSDVGVPRHDLERRECDNEKESTYNKVRHLLTDKSIPRTELLPHPMGYILPEVRNGKLSRVWWQQKG
jgi:hypothetical protein